MKLKTTILGISAYYHDSAACLLVNGEIIAAAQEERFTRKKGDNSFPHQSINYCLEAAGIDIKNIDHIVFYENPLAKFERLLTTYHLTAPRSLLSFLSAVPSWLTQKLWLQYEIPKALGIKKQISFCEHHLSHAASAFYPSPFKESAILTIDGVGEWATTTYGHGKKNKIKLLEQLSFPNSLGLLYSAFTYYTGFKINSGEYKLMGLAPYGTPRFVDMIYKKLVKVQEDGSLILNQQYFNYALGLTMTNKEFDKLFGGPPRQPETKITQKEMDIAASIQVVLNEIILKIAKHVKQKTGLNNLVLAGGVAHNSVAMGVISRENIFEHIWIQPAAGDAGGALGAALWYWHDKLGNLRTANPNDSMKVSFLGPEIKADDPEDDKILRKLGAAWQTFSETKLQKIIAEKIQAGEVIGIARGRIEYGARALGNRSILADARDPKMQSKLNQKIKFREDFRPFAPMILAKDATSYFELTTESPYMLFIQPLKKGIPRSKLPAITHLDNSARPQTIDTKRNSFIHGLLQNFKTLTNCPVIINTSFNVRGEPIVCTAEDAYRCFMATDIDAVVIGNRLLEKKSQPNQALDKTQRKLWLKRFSND